MRDRALGGEDAERRGCEPGKPHPKVHDGRAAAAACRAAEPAATPPAQEFQTYRITARLLAFKVETDGDVHLAIADPASDGTMIVELPNSGCTHGAPTAARHRIAQAKRALLAACGTPSSSHFTTLHGTATIAGVLFFDFKHGQRGVAPNAVELHPVTAFASSNCSAT